MTGECICHEADCIKCMYQAPDPVPDVHKLRRDWKAEALALRERVAQLEAAAVDRWHEALFGHESTVSRTRTDPIADTPTEGVPTLDDIDGQSP
jgi:hypothetical protein